MKNLFTICIVFTVGILLMSTSTADAQKFPNNNKNTIVDNIHILHINNHHSDIETFDFRSAKDDYNNIGDDPYANTYDIELEEDQEIRHNNISNNNVGHNNNTSYSSFLDGNTLAQNGFQTFPNPVQTTLKVSLPTGDPTDITFYNLIGQLVHESHNEGTFSESIDVSELPAGVYFLQIKYNGKTETKKVQKIN